MKHKKVLLYSGGLDSVLANFLWSPDILLYIDSQSNYSDKELEQLNNFKPFRDERLIIDDQTFDFADMEKENLIVPFRNVYFILRALHYGQTVFLGANKADLSGDKDERFRELLTELVSNMVRETASTSFAPESWVDNDFSIEFPSLAFTKTELVRVALDNDMPEEILKNIRTCYDKDSVIGCGKCGPCVQKEIALSLNGVEAMFDTDPMDFAIELHSKASTDPKAYSRQEQLEQYLKYRQQ